MAEGESARVPELGEFRLGDWLVNQDEGTLAQDGHCVRLEPRVMDLLVVLAAAPGKVIAKEDLLDQVWGGTFVEEGVLSQAVHTLRRALGDDARQPRYIQTLHRRGYRLVAAVEPVEKPIELPPVPVGPPVPSKRTEPVRSPASQVRRQVWWQVAALLGLALAAVWIISNRFPQTLRIMVLPFENRGTPQGDDAYLADGLSDEITNTLGSISTVQVVSPPDRHSRKEALEIGSQLKVDYVLQGTVEWEKDLAGGRRVRVMPRLVRVSDAAQIWSGTFEESVDPIFEVEKKLAREVMAQMGVALGPEQAHALERPPTANPDAYYAFLRGVGLENQPFYSQDHLLQAIPLFEMAVKKDPGFAAAWAHLSRIHSYLAFNTDPSPRRMELSRQALEKAKGIDPDALEVRLAEFYYTYRCLEDYAAAEVQLRETLRRFPQRIEVLESLGLLLRREGKLDEAIETFKKASALDPQEIRPYYWIGETYRAMRKYAEADEYLGQAVSLAPDQTVYWMAKAENLLAWTGDFKKVQAVIDESPEPNGPAMSVIAFQMDLYRRDYRSALSRFKPGMLEQLAPEIRGKIAVLSVVARERLGDHTGALSMAEENRRILGPWVARFPRDTYCRAYLAVTLAQLGESTEADAQVDVALKRASADRFSGPRVREIGAMADAVLGRSQKTLSSLRRLASLPYQASLSRVDLEQNPVWKFE